MKLFLIIFCSLSLIVLLGFIPKVYTPRQISTIKTPNILRFTPILKSNKTYNYTAVGLINIFKTEYPLYAKVKEDDLLKAIISKYPGYINEVDPKSINNPLNLDVDLELIGTQFSGYSWKIIFLELLFSGLIAGLLTMIFFKGKRI